MFVGIISFVCIPNNVKASFIDQYLDQEGYLYIDSVTPNSNDEALGMSSDYFINKYGQNIFIDNCNSDYSVCSVENGTDSVPNVNIKYNLNADSNKNIILSRVTNIQNKDYYEVSDMDMINYYLYGNLPLSTDDFFMTTYKNGSSINYSYNLKNKINNSGLTINILPRKGGDIGFFGDYTGGNGIVKYNGTIYEGEKILNINFLRVIYVPDNTQNLLETAQNRINSYFGNNVVTLSYCGPVTSFDHYVNYYPFANLKYEYSTDVSQTLSKSGGTYDNNYYKLTINNIDYYVLIVKNSSKIRNIENPRFIDPSTNIELESKISNIPYSFETNIKDVSSQNNLIDIFNTNKYKIYDINLNPIFSSFDISNNYFDYSIPIPNGFDSFTVYNYENGSYVQCDTTINNGYIKVNNKKLGKFAIVENTNEILPESISFELDSLNMDIGDSYRLNVNFTPTNATNKEVTYESSNPEVVDIEDGYAVGKSYGTAVITATTSNGIKTTFTIDVVSSVLTTDPEDIDFYINGHIIDSLELDEGEYSNIGVVFTPLVVSNSTIDWVIGDTSIIMKEESGRFHALSSGTTTLTATTVNGITKTLTVIVKEPTDYLKKYKNPDTGEYEMYIGMYRPNNEDTLQLYIQSNIDSAILQKVRFTDFNFDLSSCKVTYPNGTEVNLKFIYMPNNYTYDTQLSKINNIPDKSSYELNDMDVINYYLYFDSAQAGSSGSVEQNISYGLNYSTKFHNDLNNYSICGRVIPRKGDIGIFNLYTGGNIEFNNCDRMNIYSMSKYVDYTFENVLYVPAGTQNYLSYIQNRINTFYGSNKVLVSEGGTITDLYNNEKSIIGRNNTEVFSSIDSFMIQYNEELQKYGGTSNNKYYKLRINNNTYNFIIIENSSKMINYNSVKNISGFTNVEIESIDSSASNDLGNLTLMYESGNDVTEDFYSNALHLIDTNNYVIYKTQLYPFSSNIDSSKSYNIKIPILDRFKNKNIEVSNLKYSNGNPYKEKIDYTIKDNYIIIKNKLYDDINNKDYIIEEKTNRISYTTHVQNVGWQNYVHEGEMAGTSGRALRLEGIKIKVDNSKYSGDIEYRTHVQNVGWQDYVKNDEMSGTSGRALRLEAIQIRLTGEMAEHYDVYYRVHAQNFGWMNWAKNDEMAGTAGYAYRLEGIEIVLVEKGQNPPVASNLNYRYSFRNLNGDPREALIKYTTHVQNVGWQNLAYDGDMAGTSGRALRLEGIKIALANKKYSGDVEYKTHVQNIGWQDYVKNGEMSGTSGRALRLEAIQIRLTGEMAEHYDVYYRVHAQNVGWMNWAKNDEMSGTAGYAYRLEGIEIVIVEKGQNPPTRTNMNNSAFIQR